MNATIQFIAGFILGALIGYLAYRARALSPSGAWAAAISGGLIFGLGGLPWAVLLLAFFISSSVLSRAFSSKKKAVNEKFSKGSQRDWGQVFANGGLGALLAVAHALLPGQDWIWIAYVGAMAAVNADTWATEIGVLSPHLPRRVTNGQIVERGTSGGVSLTGLLAALGGAGLIGLLAVMIPPAQGSPAGLVLAAALGGWAGSLFDSLTGDTVQAIYYCPACQKETERHPHHSCSTPTIQVRGWSWLNNDWVNFGCSVAGALATVGLFYFL